MTRIRILVGLLVFGAVLVGFTTAQPADSSVSELQDRTTAVAQTLDMSQQLVIPVGTGLVIGLGLGLIGGSGFVYKYWDSKLS
jgi:hypothetical protein